MRWGWGDRQSAEDVVGIGFFLGGGEEGRKGGEEEEEKGKVGIYYALPFKPTDTGKGPVILGERLELYTVSRVHGGRVEADRL
jgi:hypothetical protein